MNQSTKNSTVAYIPVSIGELIDKITILEIKMNHMSDEKLMNVKKELEYLENVYVENSIDVNIGLINDLKNVNIKLWDIEDRIRLKEAKEQFDNDFINLARSVYIENDKRSKLKKEINNIYNSEIVEEKSYSGTR
tara:strand:- start:35 stop:439 length:405 start_codon:yes stop_codon:yes gene_type:complete